MAISMSIPFIEAKKSFSQITCFKHGLVDGHYVRYAQPRPGL